MVDLNQCLDLLTAESPDILKNISSAWFLGRNLILIGKPKGSLFVHAWGSQIFGSLAERRGSPSPSRWAESPAHLQAWHLQGSQAITSSSSSLVGPTPDWSSLAPTCPGTSWLFFFNFIAHLARAQQAQSDNQLSDVWYMIYSYQVVFIVVHDNYEVVKSPTT